MSSRGPRWNAGAGGGGESSRDSLLTPCRRRNLRKRFLEARRDTHATYPRQESCRAATKPGDFLLATGSRLGVPWFERRVLSLSPTERLFRRVPLRRRALDGRANRRYSDHFCVGGFGGILEPRPELSGGGLAGWTNRLPIRLNPWSADQSPAR